MTSRSLGLVIALGVLLHGCASHSGDVVKRAIASRADQTGHRALAKPCPGTESRPGPSLSATTGTTATRTVPTRDAMPQADFVAVVRAPGGTASQLVVVDTAGGSTERVLIEFKAAEQPIPQGLLARSPDGNTVYYATSDSTDPERGPTLWRIPTTGGDPTPLLRGRDPALSPDGHFLAFVPDQLSVAVLDLASGVIRCWLAGAGFSPEYVNGLAWSPDGGQLAMEAGVPESSIAAVFILDLARPGTLAEARRLGPPSSTQAGIGFSAGVGGVGWYTPSWRRSDGLVGVLESRGDTSVHSGANRLLLVDPATGVVRDTADPQLDPAPRLSRALYDGQGLNELLLDPAGVLYRHNHGTTARLGAGYVAVGW